MAKATYEQPEFIIKGTVTDAQTGQPIVGAKVGDSQKYNDGKFFSLTDPNGHYEYKTWYEEHGTTAEATGYQTQSKGFTTKLFGSEKEKVINYELVPGYPLQPVFSVINDPRAIKQTIAQFLQYSRENAIEKASAWWTKSTDGQKEAKSWHDILIKEPTWQFEGPNEILFYKGVNEALAVCSGFSVIDEMSFKENTVIKWFMEKNEAEEWKIWSYDIKPVSAWKNTGRALQIKRHPVKFIWTPQYENTDMSANPFSPLSPTVLTSNSSASAKVTVKTSNGGGRMEVYSVPHLMKTSR